MSRKQIHKRLEALNPELERRIRAKVEYYWEIAQGTLTTADFERYYKRFYSRNRSPIPDAVLEIERYLFEKNDEAVKVAEDLLRLLDARENNESH